MSNAFAGLNTVGSGSYDADDVHFLLRAMQIEATDVQEKERLIQTQQRHYSEMISEEHAPSDTHKNLYQLALAQNGARMAADVQALAQALNERYSGPSIALVSFVRAGLPLGVLLRRALLEVEEPGHEWVLSAGVVLVGSQSGLSFVRELVGL